MSLFGNYKGLYTSIISYFKGNFIKKGGVMIQVKYVEYNKKGGLIKAYGTFKKSEKTDLNADLGIDWLT